VIHSAAHVARPKNVSPPNMDFSATSVRSRNTRRTRAAVMCRRPLDHSDEGSIAGIWENRGSVGPRCSQLKPLRTVSLPAELRVPFDLGNSDHLPQSPYHT
jgi:hypothetical protein